MAASTTIVRAGDKSHKFSWDLINQANPSQGGGGGGEVGRWEGRNC